MSNVNDNDIDDLFRRASSQYPLRTDSADWNRLVADLDKDPSLILPPASEEDRPRRRRSLWLLLLLLPLAGIGYIVIKPSGNGGETITATAKHETGHSSKGNDGAEGNRNNYAYQDVKAADKDRAAAINEKDGDITAATDEANRTGGTGKRDKRLRADLAVKTDEVTKTGGNEKTNGVAKIGKVMKTGGAAKADGAVMTSGSVKTDRVEKTGVVEQTNAVGEPIGIARTEGSRKNGGTVKTGRAVKNKPVVNGGDELMVSNELNSGAEIAGSKQSVHTTNAEKDNGKASIKAGRAGITGPYAVNFSVKAPVTVTPATEVKKTPTKLQKTKPSFYVGLLAAPDLSTVKMQSIKGTGTTFGVLLGYQLSHRWGIETGLYLDRKKYYTNGEYFDKSKTPRLQSLDVKSLDGICNMLEIPVNVRYNLGTGVGGRTSWFATAGFSTYLMSKEYYKYTASYIGGGPVWDSEWTYRKPSQYWFSVFNLSAGYEQRLGKIGSLRLEPYIRVPLAGVGTGKLPIMSAGLNVGLTRRIW